MFCCFVELLFFCELMLISVQADVGQTCSKSGVGEGKKLAGYTYREEIEIGRQLCGKECLASVSCTSVNFNKQNLICNINSNAGTAVTALTNDVPWEFISRSDLKQTLSDPCETTSCSSYHKCVVLRSGATTCVRAECYLPPSVANAGHVSNSVTSVGMTITYACATNYRFRYGTGKIMCLPNGEYADINFECELIQCRNPPTISNTNTITDTVRNVGESITYTCVTNYRLTSGDGNLACLSSGEYANVNFGCELIPCPYPLTSISSSSLAGIQCLQVGCLAYYMCANGMYSGLIYMFIQCRIGGVWDTSLSNNGCY